MKCVIMAGGKGTRLWPVSRKNKPKQFQSLVSDKTMLQETYLRMRKKFDISDIYVSTNKEYVSEVEKEILELPPENIIGEPESRGSAASVALTLAKIWATTGNDNEIITFFPSDHLVRNPELLIESLVTVEEFLTKNPDYMLTLAIKPSCPETGFGYIEKGKILEKNGSFELFETKRFVEKPDLKTAQKYLKSGNFFWNTAMYAFTISSMVEKFQSYIPDTHRRLLVIKDSIEKGNFVKTLVHEYPEMDKIDFAYSIVENDDRIAAIPLALDWSDVGSWASLKDTLVSNSKDHFVRGEHVDFGSENLLVYGSKKIIATVGLKDLIIVDTEDAILICDQNKAGMVSDVVKKLEGTGRITLL